MQFLQRLARTGNSMQISARATPGHIVAGTRLARTQWPQMPPRASSNLISVRRLLDCDDDRNLRQTISNAKHRFGLQKDERPGK
jgi:hypothetical protein